MNKAPIIMVQHFPGTGEFLVHRQGATVDFYSSEETIEDSTVNAFIGKCLANNYFHENTVHLATGKVSGGKTLPVRQIIYSEAFSVASTDKKSHRAVDINWVLWSPNNHELTVNRGLLGLAKTFRIRDLSEATEEVREFMQGCADGQHVALSNHYSESNRTGSGVKMNNISEYFFSTGKVIYGFQRETVKPITAAELQGLGLTVLD